MFAMCCPLHLCNEPPWPIPSLKQRENSAWHPTLRCSFKFLDSADAFLARLISRLLCLHERAEMGLLPMDLLLEIIRRIELESRLVMLESERASLSRKIRSPLISPDRRCVAIKRISQAQIEWSVIRHELETRRATDSATGRAVRLSE